MKDINCLLSKRCSMCGSQTTPKWRQLNQQRVCNRCGIKHAKHKSTRRRKRSKTTFALAGIPLHASSTESPPVPTKTVTADAPPCSPMQLSKHRLRASLHCSDDTSGKNFEMIMIQHTRAQRSARCRPVMLPGCLYGSTESDSEIDAQDVSDVDDEEEEEYVYKEPCKPRRKRAPANPPCFDLLTVPTDTTGDAEFVNVIDPVPVEVTPWEEFGITDVAAVVHSSPEAIALYASMPKLE